MTVNTASMEISHAGNTGSNPVRATKICRAIDIKWRGFFYLIYNTLQQFSRPPPPCFSFADVSIGQVIGPVPMVILHNK